MNSARGSARARIASKNPEGMQHTVFITGGSGLLGLNWAAAMRDHARLVLGLHQRRVTLRGVESRTERMESAAAVQAVLESVEPDVVVHTAGLTNVETCEANPALARQVNVVL